MARGLPVLPTYKISQICIRGQSQGIWGDAEILEIESNSRHKKYKETACIPCLTNLIIHPAWISLTSGSPLSEMRLLTPRNQYDVTDSS
jgi:hypothetical protein